MSTATTDRIQTFAQWSAAYRARVSAEYGATPAEARECHPDHVLRPQWWDYALTAFNEGADFSPQAVRGLDGRMLRELSRTTRGLRHGMPRQYWPKPTT